MCVLKVTESQLHCASCRTHISKFISSLAYPSCHHLFCSDCFRKNFGEYTRQFQCPLDFMMSEAVHKDSTAFVEAIGEWWASYERCQEDPSDNTARAGLKSAFEGLGRWINFSLFPCVAPAGHPGFAECPFDHSEYTTAVRKEELVQVRYCPRCCIAISSLTCARCQGPCVLKTVRKPLPCTFPTTTPR